ncbi:MULTISPECIES: hypothetical protein [Clostridium]|uniref:hypothetical protein n=1 Tax=Clostridium TaxID=1485 RepID=UPI000C08AA8D|nr:MULTISPECIES: hypothetical protein [Clostridium]MDU4727977.1 hypothetical protein [Clostridium sp.]DAL22430.1 MAG TPA_asm: hypothetical protein [Caudoviricetes sp.]
MNIKLTDEQCYDIAESIVSGNFRMYGLGHFDLGLDEMAQIIKIAFNESNAKERMLEYYEEIQLK